MRERKSTRTRSRRSSALQSPSMHPAERQSPGEQSRRQVRSERDKMLAGELYDPLDGELVAGRERARDLCLALNATHESQQAARRRILKDLLGAGGESVWMQPPFYCDYGANIRLGTRVFFNFN